jgi:hypothetical protein
LYFVQLNLVFNGYAPTVTRKLSVSLCVFVRRFYLGRTQTIFNTNIVPETTDFIVLGTH